MKVEIRRLGAGDRLAARELFILMAEVFEEGDGRLGDAYIDRLLSRDDFWALAAFDDAQLVGGLTAHTLPMTREEALEVFIYDLAVHPAHQRRGVGRQLVSVLCDRAADHGISVVFVPADNDDDHALDFYRAIGGEAAPVTIFTFDRDGQPDG